MYTLAELDRMEIVRPIKLCKLIIILMTLTTKTVRCIKYTIRFLQYIQFRIRNCVTTEIALTKWFSWHISRKCVINSVKMRLCIWFYIIDNCYINFKFAHHDPSTCGPSLYYLYFTAYKFNPNAWTHCISYLRTCALLLLPEALEAHVEQISHWQTTDIKNESRAFKNRLNNHFFLNRFGLK
jgi:hypothetical protein